MLLHDARRDARVGAGGELVLLDDQDRARWDRATIAEGRALVERAVAAAGRGRTSSRRRSRPSTTRRPRRPTPTGPQIAALYDALQRLTPSPVVELNRAAAVAMADGPAVGLAMMDGLAAAGALDDYPYLHAARADLLAPARALVRGRRGLPAGAGADHQRPGAGVPRRPAARGREARRPTSAIRPGRPRSASRRRSTSSLVICSIACIARSAPAIGSREHPSSRADDLPRNAELVLQPAAHARLATPDDERGPEAVDLRLVFAQDAQRRRFGEREFRAAVEGDERDRPA